MQIVSLVLHICDTNSLNLTGNRESAAFSMMEQTNSKTEMSYWKKRKIKVSKFANLTE